RGVDERGFGAALAGGFEKVEGAAGIGVEIVEGDFGGEVMGRLRGGVDDAGGAEGANEVEDTGAVADVKRVMGVVFEGGGEAFDVPGGVAVGAEKLAALIVVHAMDGEAAFVKGLTDSGTDEAGRSCNQDG